MGAYDFDRDLETAKKTELEIAQILTNRGCVVLNFKDDADYDLKVDKGGIITTIEVKEDFMCQKTGNVAVEFKCRGKYSGILTTIADYYIYKIWTNGYDAASYYSIPTDDLKKAIIAMEYKTVAIGGDAGSKTAMYLFGFEAFKKISRQLQ